MLTNRTVLCIALVTSSTIHLGAQAADFSLSYLGQQIIPSGTIDNGTTIGGFSSIDYVASQNRYVAISDDRGTINPSRYYNLSLSLGQFQRSRTPGVSATTNGLPTGNTIRLFYVDARNATDVALLDSIANQNVNSVSKTLLLDLSTLQNDDGSYLALDNIEGITLGPNFNGRERLMLVSDNNFGANQFTQFTALQINRVPEPQIYALMLLGIAAIGITARRRTR